MSVRQKTLETPSGVGKLYKDGEIVARPRYSLRVTQSVHISHPLDGSISETPGQPEISGHLQLDHYLAGDLIGAELVLELEDGRRLPIYLRNSAGHILLRGWFDEA
jgi:hypothetical protein